MAKKEMARPRPRGRANHQLVLDAVRGAGRPVSAYELLGRLSERGLTAPPTIYRALRRLTLEGQVHRVESLNAYVACAEDDRHGTVGFAICDACGTVTEFPCSDAAGAIAAWAQESAFAIRNLTLEVHGTCASCTSPTTGL